MAYTIHEHTADVAVEGRGRSLGDAFAAVADGMVAAMCDDVPDGGERFELEVVASTGERALFDYLDELIYERDVRAVLPVDNEAAVRERDNERDGEWIVEASARGVPLDRVSAREIKAVTYSEMRLEATEDGWTAYVVFDV